MPSTRSWKNTGPGRLRMTGSASASGRMNASEIKKIFTFSRNARAISGIDALNSCQLKNVCLTSGHPGACVIARTSTVKKTMVLSTAIVTPRRPSPPAVTLPRIFEPRVAFRRLFQHGRVSLEPLGLQALQRAVGAELRQRVVDAADERVALLEDHAEVLGRRGRRELALNLPVRDLDRRHVESGRQVDDEAVDLFVLQRRDGSVVRVEHRRLLGRLDVVDDVVVAGRAELRPELVRLQSCDRRRARDLRSLDDDQGLVDVVVRVAEVDRLRPRGRGRDLVDVEVELLRPRCESRVEGDHDPFHLAVGEAELLGDRVRHGALVALAGIRIADLPRRFLVTAEPRRERRVVRPCSQLARGDEVQVRLLAGGRSGSGGVGRSLVARPAAAGGEDREQNDEDDCGGSAHGGDPNTPILQPMRVGRHDVSITNPDKIFFPAPGLTKGDLVGYYVDLADCALPHLRRRPFHMVRYPNGVEGDFFHQKRVPSHPEYVGEQYVEFPSGHSTVFAVIDNAAALAWVANLGCIELHTWHSRVDDIERPDYLLIDLDPTTDGQWPYVREIALVVRDVMEELGLAAYPKTSGATGLHILAPIKPEVLFPEVRRFAKALAEEVERRVGDQQIATTTWRVADRRGVFVDFGQNTRDRTIATAYSVRPTPDARVSAPLLWDEVAAVEPSDFTVETMRDRVADVGDLTADMWRREVSLVPRFPKLGLDEPASLSG